MRRPGLIPTLLAMAGLCLALAGCRTPQAAHPAASGRKQRSLDQWRTLTSPTSAAPRVLVKGDDIRFYFPAGGGIDVFGADWRKVRVPTPGYQVNSAILRYRGRMENIPALGSTWREATVVAGAEWRRLATNLIAALAPAKPGTAAYYRAFLADGVVYRDPGGTPHFAPLGATPAEVEIESRYADDETLLKLAGRLEQALLETHPEQSLFLLMAPNASRVTHPLLLDRDAGRCAWLTPGAVIDLAERGFDGAETAQGMSALLLESHGLALLKNPVSSLARLVDTGVQTAVRWVYLRPPRLGGQVPPLANQRGMDLEAWETWLDTYTGTRRQPGSLELLIDGPAFFQRFRRALEEATNRINLQVYIFDKDDVAMEIAGQLKRRAKDIEVKVILDRLGSIGGGMMPPAVPWPEDFQPPNSILRELRNASKVQVRPFLNPWFSTDHSKVLLVDENRAWLGGMNLGREYLYEWHDMMVEVRGPIVASLQRDFDKSWAHAGPWGDAAYLSKLLSPRPKLPAVDTNGWSQLRLLPTRTAWKPFSVAVGAALRKAKSHIYIQNSYLFDKRTILALVQARKRGVDVRVILPRQNDFKPGNRGNLVIANYLIDHGVRVYFYPGMTHVKALLVDGWACVGSGNLNHLSLRVNREQNIATSDPVFAAALKHELFEHDFERAYELKQPLSVDWVDLVTDLLLEGI